MKHVLLLMISALALVTACTPKIELVDNDVPQKVLPEPLESKCNKLYEKNTRGRRVSWKGRVPVTFSLDEDFPEAFVTPFKSAMETYNAAAGYELFRLDGRSPGPGVPVLDYRNRVSFLAEGTVAQARRASLRAQMEKDHGLAVTHTWITGNRILDSDIVFDGATSSFSNSRLRLGSYDFEKIALHELGHALGLDHNDEFFSVMYFAGLPFGLAIRTLDDTTAELLECEYK